MLGDLPRRAEAVEVGAGTGKLTQALLDAGARVTAVEPGAEMRALLEQRVGGRATVLDARGEELPLPDASADVVVCADSFHWLDAEAALAEFRRVLRPAGRLCLSGLLPRWTAEQSSGWAEHTGAVLGPLWERSRHPLRSTRFAVPTLGPETGFEEVISTEVPFIHHTDRDGLLALYASWSSVASLPEGERAAIRAQLERVLEERRVGKLELSYVAQVRVYAVDQSEDGSGA